MAGAIVLLKCCGSVLGGEGPSQGANKCQGEGEREGEGEKMEERERERNEKEREGEEEKEKDIDSDAVGTSAFQEAKLGVAEVVDQRLEGHQGQLALLAQLPIKDARDGERAADGVVGGGLHARGEAENGGHGHIHILRKPHLAELGDFLGQREEWSYAHTNMQKEREREREKKGGKER